MKTLFILVFIVACILRHSKPFTMKRTLLEENLEEMSEIHRDNMCYQYFALTLTVYSMFPHEKGLVYVSTLHAPLKKFYRLQKRQ